MEVLTQVGSFRPKLQTTRVVAIWFEQAPIPFRRALPAKEISLITSVIETAGNYQLLLRSRVTVEERNTEANDSWVRLSTGFDVPEEEALNGWTKLFTNVLGDRQWHRSRSQRNH